MKCAAPLLLAALLCGCQDREARAENARLQARVARLEAEVRALRQETRAEDPAQAGQVVLRAAAQNCANALARFLETTRQDAGAYPPARLVTLPDSCVDLRVNWRTLSPQVYAFDVADRAGQTLASGRSP
ncbi:hypothetical protein DAETH_29460 [Deinococcus aetherius]|uniref:Lipoprotein n=1 Tax=Deinococcus aetherius TaxID=200252 RepID=A0ABM8AGN9_9DEIO|nr:hypothetical protein [Deinococcus aetherius]BDP42977.1 hypothetical protein DAETH_29460 [Deinococcus aetherius]